MLHTFAYFTGPWFSLNANNLPNKKIGLAYACIKVVKNCKILTIFYVKNPLCHWSSNTRSDVNTHQYNTLQESKNQFLISNSDKTGTVCQAVIKSCSRCQIGVRFFVTLSGPWIRDFFGPSLLYFASLVVQFGIPPYTRSSFLLQF